MLFALIVDVWSYRAGTWVLFAISIASFAAMEIMAAWYRREIAKAPAPVASS